MLRRISSFALSVIALAAFAVTIQAQSNLTAKANVYESTSASASGESDRARDGLVGPVRRVRTEIAKLSNEAGRIQEGKHAVLEMVSYDIKGNKVENQYFPVAGANLTGKEVYKYDEKGNISEMTLVNDDGSLLSKEIYKYEFDFAGNWNKMTTSVAVIEGGRMSFEPTEVTYRSIMYYLDEKMMKMAQGDSQPTAVPVSNVVAANSDKKAAPVVPKPSSGNNAGASKTSPVLPSATLTSSKISNISGTEPNKFGSNGSNQSAVVQLNSEPPPAPAPRPILKPISGGVLNGVALNLPSPIYPDAAKRLRVSGVVMIEVVVDETGKVISAQATSGPGALREVAVQAALRARFSPTKLSGQPMKVSGVITYKFALTH